MLPVSPPRRQLRFVSGAGWGIPGARRAAYGEGQNGLRRREERRGGPSQSAAGRDRRLPRSGLVQEALSDPGPVRSKIAGWPSPTADEPTLTPAADDLLKLLLRRYERACAIRRLEPPPSMTGGSSSGDVAAVHRAPRRACAVTPTGSTRPLRSPSAGCDPEGDPSHQCHDPRRPARQRPPCRIEERDGRPHERNERDNSQ